MWLILFKTVLHHDEVASNNRVISASLCLFRAVPRSIDICIHRIHIERTRVQYGRKVRYFPAKYFECHTVLCVPFLLSNMPISHTVMLCSTKSSSTVQLYSNKAPSFEPHLSLSQGTVIMSPLLSGVWLRYASHLSRVQKNILVFFRLYNRVFFRKIIEPVRYTQSAFSPQNNSIATIQMQYTAFNNSAEPFSQTDEKMRPRYYHQCKLILLSFASIIHNLNIRDYLHYYFPKNFHYPTSYPSFGPLWNSLLTTFQICGLSSQVKIRDFLICPVHPPQ